MSCQEEDMYDIANGFDVPVVRRYAGTLSDLGVSLASFARPSIAQELVRGGIPECAAHDIVEAFRKRFRRGAVALFWDFENIPLTRKADITAAIRGFKRRLADFGDLQELNVYVGRSQLNTDAARVLHDSGAQIRLVPAVQRKETADKMIIIDALRFSWKTHSTSNPVICIVSGDSDFSPLLSTLRMDDIRTICVSSATQIVRSLREQATLALLWPDDFVDSRGSGGGRVTPPSYVPPPPLHGGMIASPVDESSRSSSVSVSAAMHTSSAQPVSDVKQLLQTLVTGAKKVTATPSPAPQQQQPAPHVDVHDHLKRLNPGLNVKVVSSQYERVDQVRSSDGGGHVTTSSSSLSVIAGKAEVGETPHETAMMLGARPIIEEDDDCGSASQTTTTARAGSFDLAAFQRRISTTSTPQASPPPPLLQQQQPSPLALARNFHEPMTCNDVEGDGPWYVVFKFLESAFPQVGTTRPPDRGRRFDTMLPQEWPLKRSAFGPFESFNAATTWFQNSALSQHCALQPRYTSRPEELGFANLPR